MGTMQDAMNAHLEEINTVAAVKASTPAQTVNGEMVNAVEQPVSPVPTPTVDVDDADGLADIIRARMARRQQFVATRDARDAGLQQSREQSGKSEVNLRDLYREKFEIENILQEETLKLLEAKKAGFTTKEIQILQVGVDAFTQDLINNKKQSDDLEVEHPEIKAKLDEEQRLVALHHRFLVHFAKEIGNDGVARYVAKGTPTPSAATIKDMDAFLKKSIREAENLGVIVSVPKGEPAAFVAHDGSRWNPRYPEMIEGVQVCKELNAYENAICAVEQKNLQDWADKDIAGGLLLTPTEVAAQKKSPQNRHNLVNMVRIGEGFCFVPIESKRPADLLSYNSVRPEMKVEYSDNKEENKKHKLRVMSVTAPQFVEDFFFPEGSGGKSVLPTFYFDDLHEIATWRRLNAVIRDSFTKGIRQAESWEKKTSIMKELSDVSRVSNLKTFDQLSDHAAGIAVIYAPKSKYNNDTFDIGFEIASDGVTVHPGPLAIDYSKKLQVYEEIIDGKPVAEFFARAKDGSFANERLQDLAVRNEAFELSWLVPAAATEYTAEEISADNVAALVMLSDTGGRDGAYVFKVSVKDQHREGETEVYRQVAYVVRRENDTLVFVAGLTRYSLDRLTEQGFALNTPYALGELKGFVLHIFRRVYSKVSGMPFDKFPEHLKGTRANAAQDISHSQKEGTTPNPS